MMCGETWTTMYTPAPAAAGDSVSGDTVQAETILLGEDALRVLDEHVAPRQAALQGLGPPSSTDGGESLNPHSAAGVACVCSTSDDVTAALLAETRKGSPRVVAPEAPDSCVDCGRCTRPDALTSESAAGVDVLADRIACGSSGRPSDEDQLAETDANERVVARDNDGKPAIDSHADSQPREFCGKLSDNLVAAAVPLEETFAEVALPTERAIVAAMRNVTTASLVAEGASAEVLSPTATFGRHERERVMMEDEEILAKVGAVPYAAAVPPPSVKNDEVESYKQQLQEMEIRLKTVWSQKEAFRQANERLSREVGRVQVQNTARVWQPPVQSHQASPPKSGPGRGKGLQRTNRRLTPRHSPRQSFERQTAWIADSTSKSALPPCSGKGFAAVPIAAFVAPPSSPAARRCLENQDDSLRAREHCTERGGPSRGKKGLMKDCTTVNVKVLQPPRHGSRLLRVKSGSQTQWGSNNADLESMNITGAPGYFPASADDRPSHRIRATSKFPQSEPNAHHHPYNQEGSLISALQADSRRSLPPVPPLDLQGVLRLQQQAASGLVALARSSACAPSGQTNSAPPDHQAFSGRRRLSSSQHSSSSGRSLTGAETSRDSAHRGPFGCLKECEFLSARRDSVTTQDSLCIGKGRGSSKHMYRQMETRRNFEDGLNSDGNSPLEGGQARDIVFQCRASINSGNPPLRKEHATGWRQSDAQTETILDRRYSVSNCPSERPCRQRTMHHKGLHLEGYVPLQSRPICTADASWKPMLSVRSTIGGLGQRGRAICSARPSLAETAMKTPRTCFLDDRIVRASHVVRASEAGIKHALLPHSTAGEACVSRTTPSPKRGSAVENGEPQSGQHSYLASEEKESGTLSMEKQLTLHVRHCMELLQCTDGRREENLKAADMSRTSSRIGQPTLEKPGRKEEPEAAEGGKRAGDYGTSLFIPSSTMISREGPSVTEDEEDSTLQACVRKPRDGYWHVIYTCVIKVRDTDFFLNVRYAGAAAEGKKCETARLVASKEQAGVFKVCIRHLLRSARDFFDSARVLWWQPLPVVCSEDWLPYDEVMRMRADTQIRALRAKHPALAAAAHERETRRTKAAEAVPEEGAKRTGHTDQEQGEKPHRVRGREVEQRKNADTTHSPFPTGRTARLVARNMDRHLYQRGREEASASGSSSFLHLHRGSVTERTSNKATANNISPSAAMDAKAKRDSGTHRGSVSSSGGHNISEGRGVRGAKAATEDPADLQSTEKKVSGSHNVCPPPPRHYSEWDAVGIVYVGSLCADQPVAQFKRILSSCSSNLGEPGGWYLTCSKAKPRCMMLSPSSDMSFLLSAPLTRSSSCSSDRTSNSVNSSRSSFTAATCRSRGSERTQSGETPDSCNSDESITSKVTPRSVNTGHDQGSPKRIQDDFSSVFSGSSATPSQLPPLAPVAERTCPHFDEECVCDSTAHAIKRKHSYSSSSSSSSSKTNSDSSISSSSCCSSRISHDNRSGPGARVISSSATSAGQKRRSTVVQAESAETAFDRTCQLSLSRKLGPQELFIVRRSDRENGCFPLYHYSSGRYLCAHATNGLVGMLCANATPAAATAARAVQSEIKASRRLAAEANRAEVGVLSQPATVRGSTSIQGRGLRKSSEDGKKTSSPSCHAYASSRMENCLLDATLMKQTLERRRTVKAAKSDISRRMTLEEDLGQKGQISAESIDKVRYAQHLSDASLTPLTATTGDSYSSTAFFPTSPFFLTRLAHQSNKSSSGMDTFPCSSDRGDTWASGPVERAGEQMSSTAVQSTDAGDIRESVREATAPEFGRSIRQAEAARNSSNPLKDSVSQESAVRLATSSSQQGARNSGALAFAKRFKIRRTRLTEHSDTFRPETSDGPSATATSLVPSLFELVTVSDLLVQQTVARILAAVPQPPTMAAELQEKQFLSEDCSYPEQDREIADTVGGEVGVSVPLAGAQFSRENERLSLALNKVEQFLTPEKTNTRAPIDRGGTSRRQKENTRYSKQRTLYGGKTFVCSPENPMEPGKAKAAAWNLCEAEYNFGLTPFQRPSASSRRNRRKSDSSARSTAITTAKIPPTVFDTYTVSKRTSLPARRTPVLPRDAPLILPHERADLAALNLQPADVLHGASMRTRGKSTYDTKTHMLARMQQQQSFMKHRQQPRRPRQPHRERIVSIETSRNLANIQSLRGIRDCEQFCLDDCDALTEIASDEVSARRLEH